MYAIDIIVLAESPFQGRLALNGFEAVETLTPQNIDNECRPEIYARASIKMSPLGGVGRGTIQEVEVTDSNESFLLAAVHLNSRMYDLD